MVDAYVLRSLVRRCNYNPKMVNNAIQVIEEALFRLKILNLRHESYHCR